MNCTGLSALLIKAHKRASAQMRVYQMKFLSVNSATKEDIMSGSMQSPQSSMQCSPLFYVGDQTHAYPALQNYRNYPVAVGVKLIYGTGETGTPNGSYDLPEITMGGQKRIMIDLANFTDELEGAKWGGGGSARN